MRLKYDLHIHSCLSPCGDDSMTPASLVGIAAVAGYDVIALSDHNSVKNCRAAILAGEAYGVCVIPAMELTTAEEAHVLCMFPSLSAAEAFGAYVYARLPQIRNNPSIFGNQLIVDEEDRVIGIEERLLITASEIGAYQVSALAESYGGVAIPAHVDRSSFSILSNLGFYDPGMGFHGVELSINGDRKKLRKEHPQLSGVGYLVNSDAHALISIPDAHRMLEAEKKTPEAVISSLRNDEFPHHFSF